MRLSQVFDAERKFAEGAHILGRMEVQFADRGKLGKSYIKLNLNLSMVRSFIFACLMLWVTALHAQTLTGISSTYNDDLTEWELFHEVALEPDSVDTEYEEELIGRLSPLWPMRKDLRDWRYEIDGNQGTIRQKWSTDKTHWELSDDESRITMQPTFPGDVSNWRLTDNNISLTLRCRYGNVADEWLVDDSKYGTFYMYTLHEGDPRDWVIKNKLNEDVPQGMQMALAFIVLYFSTLH